MGFNFSKCMFPSRLKSSQFPQSQSRWTECELKPTLKRRFGKTNGVERGRLDGLPRPDVSFGKESHYFVLVGSTGNISGGSGEQWGAELAPPSAHLQPDRSVAIGGETLR
jgi:hypothetical protein